MVRKALCTVSAGAVLALSAAAPAVACDQASQAEPTSTASPQAQQEHSKFAEKGFFRHHHHHGFFHERARAEPSSTQQSTDNQQQSSSNCDHGGSDD